MCAKKNISLEGFPDNQESKKKKKKTVKGSISKHRCFQSFNFFDILWIPMHYYSHRWGKH